MRKTVFYLCSLLITAFIIVACLVFTAAVPNKEKNGFNRKYVALHVTPLASRNVLPGMTTVCGATASHLFFATDDPEKVISLDYKLSHDSVLNFSLRNKDSLGVVFTEVDSPFVYLYAGNIPAVLSTDMQQHLVHTTLLPKGGFSQGRAFGKNQFVLRKLYLDVPEQFFVRLDSGKLSREEHLSEVHHDAGTSTDGLLQYDAGTGLFTYLFYYSNRYITFDPQLQMTGSGHTVDTFSHVRFKVSVQNKTFTSAGPDKMVNGAACVNNGNMFVHSTLKADNDDATAYATHTIIDVYQLQKGTYAGSFYLPIPAKETVRKMMMLNGLMVVYCMEKIYTFKLSV
jgi:hypothetical protein